MSRALDTNGQNARYVHAAKRHGQDRSVIHALAVGNADPAAVATRFRIAAKKHGGLVIREAHRASAYFDFPTDIIWDRHTEEDIRKLAEEADVIHLNNSELAFRHFRLKKPALLHHHGSLFRSNPKRLLDLAKHYKWVQATSTIDLLRYAPDVLTWLPSAYDVDEMQAFAKANDRAPDGRILIVHCPTNRELKHTDLLIAAVAELQSEGLPVDLELVEGRPWAESLAAKARADIVFDQLLWGYGCNGIEAWAMGKSVVAGADDWTLAEMRRQWGDLPFLLADEVTLKGVLRQIVTDPELRAQYAGQGHQHVRTYHDERPALAKLAELYADAIRAFSRPRIPQKGTEMVTFRKMRSGAVYLDDEPIPFTDGAITTDDPLVINRLRALGKRLARFGIEEVA